MHSVSAVLPGLCYDGNQFIVPKGLPSCLRLCPTMVIPDCLKQMVEGGHGPEHVLGHCGHSEASRVMEQKTRLCCHLAE